MKKESIKKSVWDILFYINEKENKKLDKFSKHKCQYWYNSGAIGGRISYEFTPTSVGTVIVVKCSCGKKEDVTDYECW